MRYVSIDIETLGLDLSSSIVEIGAVIDDLSKKEPLDKLPTFHCYIKMDSYRGEPYAMSMHSEILKKIAKKEEGYSYLYPNEVGLTFKKFLINNDFEQDSRNNPKGQKKITINVAGKNFSGFDSRFLEEHTNFHDHVRVRSRIIDPAILFYQEGDRYLPSLDKCLERAGIDKKVDHTAVNDSLDVIRLIRSKL